MPKVSVIIPTYNRHRFLERALASVAKQTFRDFEILVIQNGENSASHEIAEKFNGKGVPVRYFFESIPDAANARNVGIEKARGEYIAFLDDDDEWYPEKLKLQVEILDRSKEIGLVSCHAEVVNDQGETVVDTRSNFTGQLTLEALLKEGCVIYSLSNVLVRRECFSRVGLFDTKYSIAHDYEFYRRLIRQCDFASVEQALVKYYRHAGNMTRKLSDMAVENIEVLKSLLHRDCSQAEQSRIRVAIENHRKHYAFVNYLESLDAMDQKKYRTAARGLIASIRSNPWIGKEIDWGRFKNPLYRIIRSYLAAGYCLLLTLLGPSHSQEVSK